MKLKLTIFIAVLTLIIVCVGIPLLVLNVPVSHSERCKSLIEAGAAAELKHDPSTAKKCYTSATEEARIANMPDSLCRSQRKLAAIEFNEGDAADGISSLKQALVQTSASGGASNQLESQKELILSERAKVLKDLCSALEKLCQFKEADQACMQALSIASEAHGPSDMQEGLMADHQTLLEKMGRKDVAGQIAMARYTTFRDFHECYKTGSDEYFNKKLDDAKRDLMAACATARRTDPKGRMSALTLLSLTEFSLGDTRGAHSCLMEVAPLHEVHDGWPDEQTRYLLALAFDSAASGNDKQAKHYVSAAFELRPKAAKNMVQQVLWNTDNRDLPIDVCRSVALITKIVCDNFLRTESWLVPNFAIPAAHINLRPQCSADCKTLIKMALKADRRKTRQALVEFLVYSHDHDCSNSEMLLSIIESVDLLDPPTVDQDLCQQLLIWQGRICLSKHSYDQAERFFQRSLSLLQKHPLASEEERKGYYSDSAEGLANIYRGENKITEAQKWLRESWQNSNVRRSGTVNQWYAWRACALADLLTEQKRLPECKLVTDEAFNTLAPMREKKDFNHRMIAELERRVAEAEFAQGHNQIAILHWQTAGAEYKRAANGDLDSGIGPSLCEMCIANVYEKMKDAKDCVIWWQKSLHDIDLGTTQGINVYLQRSLWYAQLLQVNKDYPGSEKVINQALSLADKHKSQVQPSILANLYWFLSRAQIQRKATREYEVSFEQSRQLFLQAIAQSLKQAPSQAATDQESLAEVEAECAASYGDRRLYNQAELWWTRSIGDSTTKTQDRADGYLHRTLWYAQTLHQEMKNLAADQVIDRALKLIFRLKPQNHDLALARFYVLEGNMENEEHAASMSRGKTASSAWKDTCKQKFLKARELFLRNGDKPAASACDRAIDEIGAI